MAEGVSILVVLSVEFSYRSVTVMIWQVRCNFIGIKMEKYEGKEEQQQHGKKYFIEDFLLPSLNEGKFGYKLYWSDINKGEFKILWKDNRNHQNGEAEENSEVFTCWLQMKYGTTKIEKSYSKQKDTFRSCLHSKGKGKEEILERMEDDNEYRVYRFRNINIFKCKNMQQLEKCELPKAKIADESLPRHSFRLSHYSPKEAESDSGLGEEDNDTLSGSRSFNFMCQHTIEELKHIYLNGKKCEDEIFDDLDIMMDDDDVYL